MYMKNNMTRENIREEYNKIEGKRIHISLCDMAYVRFLEDKIIEMQDKHNELINRLNMIM